MDIPCCNYTINSVVKDRLNCPYCDLNYEILDVTHNCKLKSKRTTYIERYIEKISEEEKITIKNSIISGEELDDEMMRAIEFNPQSAECSLCEIKRKRRTTARKAQCPQCNYQGYYIHNGDKICPSCMIVPKLESDAGNRTVKTPLTINLDPVKYLELHFKISEITASGQSMQLIMVDPVSKKHVSSMEISNIYGPELNLFIENMQKSDYDWYWVPSSEFDMHLLKMAYKKPLGKYARQLFSIENLC